MSVDREILAEIHLNHTDESDEKVICMCTRIFLKNSFPIYASTLGNEEASEADDVFNERAELTSFRDKIKNSNENENDNDANSCYYSASHTEHTDNYCSTDEQENVLHHHKIHSSDSGADLSERNVGGSSGNEKHTDEVGQRYHHERNNSLPELFGDESTQNAWEKYWAKNGERLIWQSWIEKYIDYINPEYLDQNKMPIFEAETSADSNKLSLDDGGQAFTFEAPTTSTEIVISPPAKQSPDELMLDGWKELESSSTNNRHYLHKNSNQAIDNENFLLSPRCDSMSSSIPYTIGATTDSMTNVTRMSCTSYGFESSHVTSESTPTSSTSDDSVSSFSSEDSDDNQMATTRAAFECEKLLMENKPEEHLPNNDQDSEEYWQKRWQSHAQEQYARHYNKFMDAHRILQDEMSSSFKSDSGFLPGEMAHSSTNTGSGHKRRKKSGRKKNHSLQRLVANLHLRNDLTKQYKPTETTTTTTTTATDADDTHHHEQSDSTVIDTTETSLMESMGLPTAFGRFTRNLSKNGGGGDEPPEEKPINLKRAHESEGDEAIVDHIKSQFDIMGYAFVDKNSNETSMTKGEIVYRKKHVRLHNRMLKMLPGTSCKSKHTFFDDDGNEIMDNKESEAEMLQHSSSDEDAPIQPLNSRINNSIVPFTSQLSSDGNANEENEQKEEVNINLSIDDGVEESMQLNDEEKQAVRRERKRKRKGKFQIIIPVEIANDKVLKKYWYKRFSLFSYFDQGIQLDRESWFSVTPEKVATYTAERCKCDIIVDGFCGVGGNCIQFAKTCNKVIAIDIDPKKIEMACHNAKIYGVEDKIDFVVGNYFDVIKAIKADIVFLSPPWGGPAYMKHDTIYDLEESLLPVAASILMEATRKVTNNIVMYLPRNSNTKQLATLAGPGNAVEIEQNFLDRKLVAITAYYGELVQKNIMK